MGNIEVATPTAPTAIPKGVQGITATAEKAGSLIGRNVNVESVAKKMGLTGRQTAGLAKELGKRRISEVADTITKTADKGILSKFSKKVIFGGASGIIGLSGITTWLASDNIISSMNIFSRDLIQNVKYGYVTTEDAVKEMDTAQEFVDGAKNFIDINTQINPLLWPFRRIILKNADAANEIIKINRKVLKSISKVV